MSKAFIIAEAGVNHNGDLNIAKKLVDAAKFAGADAVKFQTFTADTLVSKKASKAGYQERTTSAKESQYEMIKALELSPAKHKVLMAHCRARKIMFMSTPFDIQSVDLLANLGVKIFKIPSGEITNEPLLVHIAHKGKPIILSTGMADLQEVRWAVKILRSNGCRQLTVLHCVTEYPAPFDEMNLKAIPQMAKLLRLPIGFSDHSMGIAMPLAATALGAVVIEKHLTLDRGMKGPDHKASLEPKEFKDLVDGIRQVSSALGDGRKRPMPCEVKYKNLVRKSVVALRDMKAGDRIRAEDIAIKRPAGGIPPVEYKKVLGRVLKRAIDAQDVVCWKDVK